MKVLIPAGVILLLLILIGATYQGVATALERRRFPYPGRMIDVGTHQLHLHCTGVGAPAVVLEAPLTTMSAAWAWVQMDLEALTRVCSYDRAGLGWSEAGDAPFSPQSAVTELNTVLSNAGERGPYIISGAEFGAALATLYAERYTDDTTALVLVNPPGASAGRAEAAPSPRFIALSPWLARTGLLRATRLMSMSARELPQPAAGALRAFLNRPDHLARSASELATWNETVARSEAAVQPGDLPVIEVEVEGSDRVALLANRRNAQAVSDAIARAVMRVRGRRN